MSEARDAMSLAHRGEWELFRANGLGEILSCPQEAEEKFVKTMKYIAETLRITQDGERRALEFCEGGEVDAGPLQFSWDEGDAGNQDSL